MIDRGHLQAVWRMNRLLPCIGAGLMLLDLILFVFLTQYQQPREVAGSKALLQLQERTRLAGVVGSDPVSRFRQGRADLQRFREDIPERRDFSDLISDLQSLALKSDLSIDQIGYSPKVIPSERLLAYTLSFDLTGRYAALKRFVNGLERSSRLISIDKISLSAAGGHGSGEKVRLQLVLTTYFRDGDE